MLQIDEQKQAELWKQSFLLLGNQQEKDWLWRDFAGGQFAEVMGRLIFFYSARIVETDMSVQYPTEFHKRIQAHVGETIGAGFYIYCADAIYIRHEFKDIFSVKQYGDPGLKEYLMKQVERLVDSDDNGFPSELEPPHYVFETTKDWAKFWLAKIIPEDTTFAELQSGAHKEMYLAQIAWLLYLGYAFTSLQKRYHDQKMAARPVHKVKRLRL